jgi:gamma-glutamyl-gamma-aminobutyraldehyde dehydrogenase
MGGKSPQILLPDALAYGDELFDQMIDASFLTMGQNCTAGSRILVHESIADEVSDRFAKRARQLVVGPPLDPATDIGPLITQAAADRVNALVDRAVDEGAEILLRGSDPAQSAPTPQYVAPIVLRGCAPDSEIQQTEIFGPVATLTTFASEDEAVALANNTSYGLAASVWTRNLDAAMRLSRAVKAGVVSVNCYSEGGMSTPFGGYKQSGFGGKERAFEAFDQWVQTKTVWIQLHRTSEQ